jgi:O-antigen/teichoic acid export membrane protein
VLSDDSRSQKASLNMVASILDYGARVVVGLLINPLLVSRLGDLAFGVYQTLARLIGWATPAGGRPSQALKWTIARHQHSVQFEEKRLQVGSAVAVWFIFLPVLALAGGLLAWFSPLILGLPDDLHLTVRVAAGLLVVDLIATNLLSIPQSVVQGENLGYKRMGVSMLVVFAGGGLMAALVVLGTGIVGVAAAVVATTFLTGVLWLWVARKHIGWFGMERPALRTVGSFMRLSGWFLLWNLVMQLMRGSDVVVLATAGSPELVTVYTLSRYVPEAIFGAVAIVVSGIMPGLGGLMGARDMQRAAMVRSESMMATWLLTTAAGAAFLLWQESFLSLWVGREYYPGASANLLIVLMIVQFAFIRNDSSIIDLTLQLRGKVLLGLVSAGVSVGVAVLFMRHWDMGLTGLALGYILGRSIVSLAYPWIVCRSLGIAFLGQLNGSIRPLAFSAALFAAATVLAVHADVESWILLGTLSMASLAVFGAGALFLGLSGSQRARLAGRVRQVVGAQRPGAAS